MVNAQLYPGLEQIQDQATKAALQKVWEVIYLNQNQIAAAFAVVSPATQAQVKALLGLQ